MKKIITHNYSDKKPKSFSNSTTVVYLSVLAAAALIVLTPSVEIIIITGVAFATAFMASLLLER